MALKEEEDEQVEKEEEEENVMLNQTGMQMGDESALNQTGLQVTRVNYCFPGVQAKIDD